MGETTEISWADATWNPWIGCARVSEACGIGGGGCYAEEWDERFNGGVHWGKTAARRVTSDENWRKPLAWDRKAAREGTRPKVFCASLADVFESRDDLDAPRARMWELIESTRHLIWLLLTKRPENILDMVPGSWVAPARLGHPVPWPSNVWVGATVENQRRAEERLPHLCQVPTPVRWLSCEPLLGPLDLARVEWRKPGTLSGFPSLGWIIAGGESGKKARPSHPDWFRSLRDQCAANGVPFHFKQHGEWVGFDRDHFGDGVDLAASLGVLHKDFGDGATAVRIRKKNAGRLLDGVLHDAVPEVA